MSEFGLSDDLRTAVEQAVSGYLDRAWRVTGVESKHHEASHPAAILSDETFGVFVKLGQGELARDQFEREVAGLRLLAERGGALTPTVIDTLLVEDGMMIIMAAVQAIERGPAQWRQIGRALAQLHQVKGTRFGLDSHAYWGSLYQDNAPLEDWSDFFRERRLLPRLQAAADSGNLPLDLVPQVEALMVRLPALCGGTVAPTLLHGDAHHNNFISTVQGPVMIDPAVYFGHSEMDLAYVDFFGPVPDDLFAGYKEIGSISPGFAERRDLWRIHAWLAMVQVDGPQHVGELTAALRRYV